MIKSVAVIPFYNEERTINNIILHTLKYVDKVIAVNDGSTDNSLQNLPENENVILINLTNNSGKGFALNKGFEYSIALGSQFTFTLDADLQHNPDFIPDFFTKIVNYDIVIGSRKKIPGTMPIHRIASNALTSYLMSKKTGQKIIDSQSGYRLYKTRILRDILPSSTGFEAESEILINAAKKKYKIGDTEISTIYGEEKSKMKNWQAIKGFLKVLTK